MWQTIQNKEKGAISEEIVTFSLLAASPAVHNLQLCNIYYQTEVDTAAVAAAS